MYLVVFDTIAHVDIRVILGIAETPAEVHSLFYNFFKWCGNGQITPSGKVFEDAVTNYELTTYQISQRDATYISTLIEKYDVKEQPTPRFVEDLFGVWTFATYVNDGEKVIFDNGEVSKIKTIISNAKVVL
jgi:hypothetical protein